MRTYRMCATSDDERDTWIQTLQRSISLYLTGVEAHIAHEESPIPVKPKIMKDASTSPHIPWPKVAEPTATAAEIAAEIPEIRTTFVESPELRERSFSRMILPNPLTTVRSVGSRMQQVLSVVQYPIEILRILGLIPS